MLYTLLVYFYTLAWIVFTMAKNYESDITQFLKSYKKKHPDTEARQREGRLILWDKQVNQEWMDNFRAAKVAQQPYVYYPID